MAASSDEVDYLMQREIFIVCNFANTHLRHLSCVYVQYSLSVYRNKYINMFSNVIF